MARTRTVFRLGSILKIEVEKDSMSELRSEFQNMSDQLHQYTAQIERTIAEIEKTEMRVKEWKHQFEKPAIIL